MGMNVIAPNLNLTVSSIDQWFPIWKLSRVLKSCGYIYKGSADGTGASGNKETAGAFLQDKWGPGGIVAGNVQLSTQTGTAASITTITNNIATVTGLTGMTTSSVGHSLQLSNATNFGNNGLFTIVSFVSATSVTVFNANPGVVENTSAITWSERISGSASVTWSAVSAVREQTITGLTGMTTNSPGRFINFDGATNGGNNGVFKILKYISPTSVVIVNTGGVSETHAANWVELDPLLDVYPPLLNITFGSWIVLQGPSTLKIPISAVSVGTFQRGENVTQSVTGAQGEIFGYQYDTPSAQGNILVMPRKDGSGAGTHGWSNTGVTTITGGTSGATVTTATSTPVEYVRESIFWKGNASHNLGTIFHCVVDPVAESTSRLSSLLTATGCTNVVPPGGGGTNNAYPELGNMTVKGSAVSAVGTNWIIGNQTTNLGKVHIMAANADYTANTSADGTWTIAVATPLNSLGAYIGIGFYRVDNNEDGDVDPYVWLVPIAVPIYSEIRTGQVASPPPVTESFCTNVHLNQTYFKGWRRRGFPTMDMMQNFQIGILGTALSTSVNQNFSFTVDNDQLATSVATLTPRMRDLIWIISTQVQFVVNGNTIFGKMRKGTLRWAYIVAGGNSGDGFDNKKWIQLSNNNGSWIVGPWDGVTSPLQV